MGNKNFENKEKFFVRIVQILSDKTAPAMNSFLSVLYIVHAMPQNVLLSLDDG